MSRYCSFFRRMIQIVHALTTAEMDNIENLMIQNAGIRKIEVIHY